MSSAVQRDLEVITSHINADFDALGSMLAAARLYPGAKLVLPGSQERSLRNFYVESVCFFYDFVRIRDIELSRVKRLVVVDTRQRSRIGALAALVDDPEVEVHIYDHHPPSEEDFSGQVEVVRTVGATVSIMTELLRERGMELPEDEATILALGIYEDTGGLTFPSTTPEDLRAAAWLLEQGAKLGVVSSMLSRELTREEVAALSELIDSATHMNVEGLTLVVAELSSENYIPELAVVVHRFMEMEGAEAVFVLARMQGRVQLVARSRTPEVDVGAIAKALGGGGHPTAASASVRGATLPEARERLMKAIRQQLTARLRARDIMTSPVISVPPGTSLNQAHERLTRYSINVLPVVEEDKVLGLITRQTVEKAIFHGLGELAVEEYMTPGVEAVAPDAPLEEVERILLNQRQRLLPVMEERRLVGVITRTDLLNILLDKELARPGFPDAHGGVHHVRQKNITNLLRERLPRDVVEILQELGEVAEELGYNAYLVGGCVRDLFLRRENLDLDVVVEGDGIGFARAFATRRDDVRVREHRKFNTAKLVFDHGLVIDVATARLEYYSSPAALPVVEHSSLKLDLYRRDFTINTLAVKLNARHFGTLIDFFGALRDIKEGVIRVLHNLSFVEDPTRVFRAVRFEQRFGFKIGRLTASLIRNAIRINAFERLDGRRLMGELKLILEEEELVGCIKRLGELKLLRVFHPRLVCNAQMEALLTEITKAITWYQLSFIDRPLRRWVVGLSGLVDQLEDEQFREMAARLELGAKFVQEFIEMRAQAREALNQLSRRRPKPSQVYFLLSPLKTEYQLYIMARASKKWVKRAVSQYLTSYQYVRPELNGEDLKAMGYQPGPIFKEILDRLLAARLDGEVTNRQQEQQLVMGVFPLPKEGLG